MWYETACKGAFNITRFQMQKLVGQQQNLSTVSFNTFNIKHMMRVSNTCCVREGNILLLMDSLEGGHLRLVTSFWKEVDLVTQIRGKVSKVLNMATSEIYCKTEAAEQQFEDEAGTSCNSIIMLRLRIVLYCCSRMTSIRLMPRCSLKGKEVQTPIIGVATSKGGESYYIAHIKHFGDADTPWNEGEACLCEMAMIHITPSSHRDGVAP